MKRILAAVFAFCSLGAPAHAEDVTRYSLEKTANGYVRMDKQSGEMSICSEKEGQLICRLAVDERSALERQIEDLAKRLDAVDERLATIDKPPVLQDGLPSAEEFDKSLTMMEKFFRRFMGVVKEFDDNSAAPGANPQKT